MKLLIAFNLSVVFSACLFNCSAQTDINYRDKRIHYVGRIDYRDSAAVLTWSASSAVIKFEGTGVKATLKDDSGYDFLTVVLDDKVVNTI